MAGEYWRNELNANALSGSEIVMTNLEAKLGKEFLNDYHFTLSRLRGDLPDDKIRIFYAHDLPNDPESINALKDNGWMKFHRIVFVSNWQQQQFIDHFQIPWSRCVVMRNAIEEIEVDLEKKFARENPIKLIYHTTPHRGLGLLVPVFQKLAEDMPGKLKLDVYSSFKIYGWEQRDAAFEPLYDQIREHPDMNYHGSVSNEEVRKAVAAADIYAYPSVWTETSCMSLIEAMSAGCLCVHPNLGALYETASQWTFMYPFHEDPNIHAGQFYDMLKHSINLIEQNPEALSFKLINQKSFTDITYGWDSRINEWKAMLESIRNLPREIEEPKHSTYTYEVNV